MSKDKRLYQATPIYRRRRTYAIIFAIYILYLLISTFSHHPASSLDITWSDYAYSSYATNQDYLCNSLMLFDQLHNLNSPADRVLFYPRPWDTTVSSSKDRTSQLLVMARDKYKVKLKPVDIFTLKRHNDDTTWDSSVNKLHAWDLRAYKRVIHLDSDITLLGSIDELFMTPLSKGSPVAMPRAYWQHDVPIEEGGGHKLTSLLVVLDPTRDEAQALWDLAAGVDESSYEPGKLFDMEMLNARYGDNAVVLPHRPFALVTGEFRRTNHSRYLGNGDKWDAKAALDEAKIVHFSDWPLPKPHVMWPNNLMVEMQPVCEINPGTASERGCENRQVWKGLYDDFRRRRKDICRLLSVPAPQWPPKKKMGDG